MAKLTPAQISQVTQWAAEGASLSVIQGRMTSELGLSMTFLDVRFLVDDLNLSLIEKEDPKKVEEPVVEEVPSAEVVPADPLAPVAAPAGAVNVKVEVDTIARPGSMVSGNVTFTDGQVADWYVDNEGRPGLYPRTKGYQPNQPDILDFQTKLDLALRQAGF